MQVFLALNHKEYVTGCDKYLIRPFEKFNLDPSQRVFIVPWPHPAVPENIWQF